MTIVKTHWARGCDADDDDYSNSGEHSSQNIHGEFVPNHIIVCLENKF